MNSLNIHKLNNTSFGNTYKPLSQKVSKSAKIIQNKTSAKINNKFKKIELDTKIAEFYDYSKTIKQFAKTCMTSSVVVAGIGILTDLSLLTIIAAFFSAGAFLVTETTLYPMLNKKRDNIWNTLLKEMTRVGFKGFELENFANPIFQKHFYERRIKTQENLQKTLIDNYPASINREQISEYIKNNYKEFFWNSMAEFCVKNCGDKNGEANYNNFIKLNLISKEIYNAIDLEYGNSSKASTLEDAQAYFESIYPYNDLTEFLPVASLKDKNGIINDKTYNSYSKFIKQNPKFGIEVLKTCKNKKDNSICWDAISIFQETAQNIDQVLTRENYNKKNKFKTQIILLQKLCNNSQNEQGFIDIKKLLSLSKELKHEIFSFGIKSNNKIKDLSLKNENMKNTGNLYLNWRGENVCEYIRESNANSKEILSFLYSMTTEFENGIKLAKDFSESPQKGNDLKRMLLYKLGNNTQAKEMFDTWYNDENSGYKKAYSDYYNKKYNEATDLISLINQSPNVAPWAFLNKAKQLKVEPILGELPESFEDIELFRNLIKELSKNKIKDKFILTIKDKKFEIERIEKGLSTKAKYKITPENDETYIVKFNEYDVIGNTKRCEFFRTDQALRGDSPYIDAMIDFYLKTNNCKNCSDIKFYDYKSKAILYKFSEGKAGELNKENFYNLYTFNNSNLVKEIKDLGIILNDIQKDNFIKDNAGNYILIDTGHADYSQPFRPMVMGKHISLSNLSGRSLE